MKNKTVSAPIHLNAALAPYTAPWEVSALFRLLHKVLPVVSQEDVDYFSGFALEDIIAELTKPTDNLPLLPIKDYDTTRAREADNDTKPGSTWVFSSNNDSTINFLRKKSLQEWCNALAEQHGMHIQETLFMFWLQYFEIHPNAIYSAQTLYDYYITLRIHGTGNIKKTIKAVLLNAAMLEFTDSATNTISKTNTFFADKLFNSYSLDNATPAGYLPSDLLAAARILSGWQYDPLTKESTFNKVKHDTRIKRFSPYFNTTVIIGGTTKEEAITEMENLVDMIFERKEATQAVCRKLYCWFVNPSTNELIEQNIIQPLATLLKINDYDIMPVLQVLLNSNHFFSNSINTVEEEIPADNKIPFKNNSFIWPNAKKYLPSKTLIG